MRYKIKSNKGPYEKIRRQMEEYRSMENIKNKRRQKQIVEDPLTELKVKNMIQDLEELKSQQMLESTEN